GRSTCPRRLGTRRIPGQRKPGRGSALEGGVAAHLGMLAHVPRDGKEFLKAGYSGWLWNSSASRRWAAVAGVLPQDEARAERAGRRGCGESWAAPEGDGLR
ncbi:50S ribosomal protein L2P, putative, partial [Stigmatella aurantiaca DW4/3-1]